jgi:two-component system NtrC family sensor kinase
MKRLFYLIIGFITPVISQSQSNTDRTDSLKQAYYSDAPDAERVKTGTRLISDYTLLNIDSAIVFAFKVTELANTLGDEQLVLRAKWAQADALSERDIPASMKIYYEILEIYRRQDNKAGMASCYVDIGLLYLYTGSTEKYIFYLQKAKSIHSILGDFNSVNDCNAEIGGIYGITDSDSAKHYLNLAAVDSSRWSSQYYQYYWGNAEKKDNPNKARLHFLRSLELSKQHDDLRCYSLASRWFCIFLQNQNQIDSAIVIGKGGLNAANKSGFYRGVVNNSEQLHKIYDGLNQTDSAYKYLSIFVEAKNALLSQDKIDQIQQAAINQQQRSSQLEAEKEQIQARIKLFGAGGVAFILLVFALFFYRNQLKSRKSNNLLKQQSEEINNKNVELHTSYKNLKSAQSQLIQAEKMASLGELTAGIAHEIQNPLNFVNNFSEVSSELVYETIEEVESVKTRHALSQQQDLSQRQDLSEDKESLSEITDLLSDVKSNLEKITHHGKRADAIVKGMLAHSSSSKGEKTPTDLNALAEEYLKLSYHGLRAKDKSFNADFKTDFDPNLPKVNMVPQDIGRVLLNLINNAFQAVNGVSNPIVTVKTELSTSDQVLVTIKDNGPGIPDDIKDKIFQPFFTTKPTGEGTGLGLSLSYDIVKAHGGELILKPNEGEGTAFIIHLPQA